MFTTINIDADGNVTQIQSIVQMFFENQVKDSLCFHNRMGSSMFACMGWKPGL